jgi:tetratricopeptide (TPR) repeat protein
MGKRLGSAHRSIAALLWLIAWVACTGPSNYVQRAEKSGDFGGAAQQLEQNRNRSPNDLSTRIALTEVDYQLARKAIDEGRQNEYVEYLRKAQAELLQATRIDPTSPDPHTWMGIITAYQGDLEASANSFRNALHLASRGAGRYGISGTFYSNLAHIAVYQGKLSDARRYLERAERAGAPEDEIERISVLTAWKANEMTEARDTFNNAVLTSRPFAETWDQAKLPKPMQTFTDFARVCCTNPTCGPHMENACERERQAVARRQVDIQIQQQEMQLERERRQKLREIYDKRRDVEITVEDPNTPAPPPDAPGSAAPIPVPAQKRGSSPR